MRLRWAGILLALLSAGALSQSNAGHGEHNDYSKAENWLCRPDKAGPCTAELTASVVGADGSVKLEPFVRAQSPKVDCFYVYPTSSEDQAANSDMHPGREALVTTIQFGRFGAVCRQFAPLYRSATLRGLVAELEHSSTLPYPDHELAYQDVLDAWKYYLQHENHGRGVVLIGHSQGARLLIRLMQEQFDGKPQAQSLVSAIVPGWTVLIPADADRGGTFKSLPICTRANQSGCVVAYSSFELDAPPSTDPPARFGHAEGGMHAACSNPAGLGSSTATLMDSYFSKGTIEWSQVAPVLTPFVRPTEFIRARCVSKDEYNYLEIELLSDTSDKRARMIPGEKFVNGVPDRVWGLHAADVSIAMGDLLSLVARQTKSWTELHE